METQGKYHGQRIKAKDVLQLYAAGERDFRGAILRGQNFRGADLSEADFSRADIRSTQFVDVTLRGVKFCGSQCGLQRRWVVGQKVSIVAINTLSGFLQAFLGAAFASLLLENLDRDSG